MKIEVAIQNDHIAKLVKRYLHSTSFKEDEETLKEMDAWLEHYNVLSDNPYTGEKDK